MASDTDAPQFSCSRFTILESRFTDLFLLVVINDFELCIDNIAVAFTCGFFCAATWLRLRTRPGLRTWTRTSLRRCLLVKVCTDFLELALQIVVSALDCIGVVAINRVAHRSNGIF